MNKSDNPYYRHRFPLEVISHAVWLYHRFTLSFRDIEEILAIRGIQTSYESIRRWCLKFPRKFTKSLRKRQGKLGDFWYLDEVFITVNGKRQYLWRAVDQDGDVIDILMQSRRNRGAALRFFRKLFKGQASMPWKIITDKLRSYQAALCEIAPSLSHITDQYENNRAEVSHQPTRQQERQMRRFKSPGQAQRFLSFHGLVNNLFRQQRHLISAEGYRILRGRAFVTWEQVTCAC
ncbi:MAG: IS6 family transposase [Candidatus Thiodiazotropha sp. (ex. Lucinoma kazani)]